MPKNDFCDTPVISTQLHLCDSTFVITRFTALRNALSLSNPKAVILIFAGHEEKCPSRFVNRCIQRVQIEIADRGPAARIRLVFEP